MLANFSNKTFSIVRILSNNSSISNCSLSQPVLYPYLFSIPACSLSPPIFSSQLFSIPTCSLSQPVLHLHLLTINNALGCTGFICEDFKCHNSWHSGHRWNQMFSFIVLISHPDLDFVCLITNNNKRMAFNIEYSLSSNRSYQC